jgi:hypothetical protein
VTWQASSPQTLYFVEYYIDDALSQSDATAPYSYNGSGNSLFDTTKLSPGVHTLGLRALASDNRTYSYNAATITVSGGPANTALPSISGTFTVGSTLQTSTGTWTGSPAGYTYQWLRCDSSGGSCGNISGATANTWVVATADVGNTLRCTVTATNSTGSTPATSAAVLIPGATKIALVQSKSAEATGAKTVSLAFTNANTAGNLIVAFVRMSSTTQTVALSDSLGNTYATAVSKAQAADGHQTVVLYARNIRAGSNTVRATTSGTNNHPFLAIYEFSGLSTSGPLDQTASAEANDSTAISVGPRTTSAANELIFIGAGFPYSWGGTVTPGPGFTLGQQDTATSRAVTGFRIVSSTAAYTGTFSLDSQANWTAVMITFR